MVMTTLEADRPDDDTTTQLAFSVSALATAAAAIGTLVPIWPPEGMLCVAVFYLIIGSVQTSARLHNLIRTV